MKINLNFQIKGIDGKDLPKKDDKGTELESNNIGKVVGQALWHYSSGKSLKFDEWGRKLYQGETIDIDSTDYEVIVAWLETYAQDPNYKGNVVAVLQIDGIRAQVIRSFKDQKEKQAK